MPGFKTLDDLDDIRGKRVMVRVDLNVPVKDGAVADATRIERVAPTVRELSQRGAKTILLAHWGRPGGEPVADMSLAPVAKAASQVFDRPVMFASDCIGQAAADAVGDLSDGDILLLENTRFHPGEESDDPDFAQALCANCDLYVNDAFSAAHRAHASTHGIARRKPSVAGRAMESELEHLQQALLKPQAPVTAIVGGAKVSTKIDLLFNLVDRVDTLIIGGGMANTFLAALGVQIGRSLQEEDLHETATRIMDKAAANGVELLLPDDVVIARELASDTECRTVSLDQVPGDWMILDAGPHTVERINSVIGQTRTLVWNGPLGAFETPPFDAATLAAARHAAQCTQSRGMLSVAGGGDTVAALRRAGVMDDFTYVSTAGGAFLEWMEGKTLPGIEALRSAG